MKECIKCRIPKPNDEFYLNSHSKDGRVSVCKVCKFDRDESRRKGHIKISELLRNWRPA